MESSKWSIFWCLIKFRLIPPIRRLIKVLTTKRRKSRREKKLNRVISCTSVNSFHNEHLTYIIALFENGFMNKTDIKVKKIGKVHVFVWRKRKSEWRCTKKFYKDGKDSYKIGEKEKEGLMKSEVNAKQSKFKKNIPFICAAPTIDYFIDFICLYPYGGFSHRF